MARWSRLNGVSPEDLVVFARGGITPENLLPFRRVDGVAPQNLVIARPVGDITPENLIRRSARQRIGYTEQVQVAPLQVSGSEPRKRRFQQRQQPDSRAIVDAARHR